MHRLGEIALISNFLAPLATHPGAFALKDDAALLTGISASGLVVTADALVAGVHFFEEDNPADVAFKALAVNISDLASKGAAPQAYTLTLALTEAPTEAWARDFASGLRQAQERFLIALIGGDTVSTGGPWWLSITAFGEASSRGLVPRGAARPGDYLYVSGTLGDAALGLQLRLDAASFADALTSTERDFLLERYLHPQPRLALAPVLAAEARAAMDISDGLALDLSRMCAASKVSAQVMIGDIPLSAAAKCAVDAKSGIIETIVTGGDDYEILAAVPADRGSAFEAASRDAGVKVTRIGRVQEGEGQPKFLGADGSPLSFKCSGFEHFKR
ncbi:MAG: thiamine-phosphate kinase [Rhodomicrobium sp.]